MQASTDSPCMASAILVPDSARDVHTGPNSSPIKQGRSVGKPNNGISPFGRERKSSASGMGCFRKHLASEGISNEASELISKSMRSGTLSNYESAWRKLVGWCSERNFDPVQSSLNAVLDYLASLYKSGLQYRTINSHRSAISAYHAIIEGYAVGKHPRVCALLKGVFNCRTPQPKYSVIWDVEVVLRFLKSLTGELSNKHLTCKLSMLLALCCASRCHELNNLDIRFMSRSDGVVKFDFGELTKKRKVGDPPTSLSFECYPHDVELCPVVTLDSYLARSNPWRRTGLIAAWVSETPR